MTFTHEELVAYADGALTGEALQRIEKAVAEDAALAELVARHKALGGRLSAAYSFVLDEAVPDSLLQTIIAAGDAAKVVSLVSRRAPNRGLQWAALAACLVAGVIAGNFNPFRTGGGLIDGDMQAQGSLAVALDQELALGGAGPVRVGVSFRKGDGGYCRTFTAGQRGLAGLACHEDKGWKVQVAAAIPVEKAETVYRQASSIPPAVAAVMDVLMAGEALDAKAEAEAKAKGWRSDGKTP